MNLGGHSGMELRINPITGEPVLFATHRARRPHYAASKHSSVALDEKHGHRQVNKMNPFAEGNEQVTDPEVWVDTDLLDRQPNTPGWKVRVIPNKFPIVDRHEVIILSPDSKKDLGQMSSRQAQRVMRAYLARAKEHNQAGQVFIFCNSGLPAGASIAHPHSQLMVFPTLPPILKREVFEVEMQLAKRGKCLYCDLLERELRQENRLVWQNSEFAIICPEASGWPYELLLLPKIHQATFGQLKEVQIEPLAEAMQVMLRLYHDYLLKPPYNYWIHSVRGHFFHWHIELIPRTKTLAGVELGAGIMVNDRITPEDAAQEFRLALKRR